MQNNNGDRPKYTHQFSPALERELEWTAKMEREVMELMSHIPEIMQAIEEARVRKDGRAGHEE